MQALKSIFFLLFALLSAYAIADITGKFNIVSEYYIQKTLPDGTKVTQSQRNPVLFQKTLKSERTLAKLVQNFPSWSNGEYLCTKAVAGPSYNVKATHVFKNKSESDDANQRAKSVINQHRNDE